MEKLNTRLSEEFTTNFDAFCSANNCAVDNLIYRLLELVDHVPDDTALPGISKDEIEELGSYKAEHVATRTVFQWIHEGFLGEHLQKLEADLQKQFLKEIKGEIKDIEQYQNQNSLSHSFILTCAIAIAKRKAKLTRIK